MFQGDAAKNNGSMYFDDLNLVQTAGQPQGNWNIVWSDEFTGSSIISSNWGFDIGNNSGWGNNELEYYTSLSQNAYVSNGMLNLVALNQAYDGYNYTSARINSAATSPPIRPSCLPCESSHRPGPLAGLGCIPRVPSMAAGRPPVKLT